MKGTFKKLESIANTLMLMRPYVHYFSPTHRLQHGWGWLSSRSTSRLPRHWSTGMHRAEVCHPVCTKRWRRYRPTI